MQKKVIRFKRRGSKFFPFYDIVVVYNKKKSKTGTFIERIGFFDPMNRVDENFCLNFHRLGFWLNRGAVLNKTVKKYITKFLT